MKNLSSRYCKAYERLGHPLRRRDGISSRQLAIAARQLPAPPPTALIDYYRIAGRAVDLHSAHDHLLAPADWCLDRNMLVFMEENQAVVLYGVKLTGSSCDPPVAMAANGNDPLRWLKVCASSSEFLLTMLHWEAAFGGGMPFGGTACVSRGLRRKLDREWTLVGEVNRMRAYTRPGISLCFVEWEPEWRVFVGSVSEDKTRALCADLDIELQCELGIM